MLMREWGSPELERFVEALIDQSLEASLGSLVKGIVHNFNGTLQVLSMKLELLQTMLRKEGIPPSSSTWTKTEECLAQLDRLQKMVEMLSQKASVEETEEMVPIRLNELLEEELSFLNHDLFFKHQVELQTSFASTLPPLKGRPLEIRLGLGNLIRNGIEAMEGSSVKKLTVATESRDHDLWVTIEDTGCGITKEIEPSLFTPFFTTKGGRHKGLGLFIARKVLTPYGASFHYRSGGGTTVFSVRLSL